MSTRYKIAVWVFAAMFAALGLRWMFGPESAAAELGIILGDAVALNTARGDLGGMFIAASILCGVGVLSGDGRWLQAVAVVIGCIAVGRTVGLLMDGYASGSIAPLAVEIVMVVVLVQAARPSRSRLQLDI